MRLLNQNLIRWIIRQHFIERYCRREISVEEALIEMYTPAYPYGV